MTLQPFFEELLRTIVAKGIGNKDELHKAKIALCGEYKLQHVPSDSEVLAHASPELRDNLRRLLRTKKMRTASGVAVVSVMTVPHPCPHGRCHYCPGGPGLGTPQSYTGREPAAMRAAQYSYDPYGQTRARLDQLAAIGHPTDKVELIIIGGTFTNLDAGYRESFVLRCLDAMNQQASSSLRDAQALNEMASSRCVGLTVETRPDCFSAADVIHSMMLGATRIEFGVQSLDDDVLDRVNRGHSVSHTQMATRVAKDAGLKVCYHVMPGLPGSNLEKDFAAFKTMFEDDSFKPDMLKIYPTVVLEGTELYKMWRRGDYTPMTTSEAVHLIVETKRIVPPWVRIQRIQREIEVSSIEAGIDKGHLRSLAKQELAMRGEVCGCIRCREVGLSNRPPEDFDLVLRRIDYQASGGTETFLSLEGHGQGTLAGYLRMRSCDGGSYLRELKVFGEVVPFGEPPDVRWQHQGYGRRLVEECERIAEEEWDAESLRVTSGVGARGYYRKLGYDLREPYMIKVF